MSDTDPDPYDLVEDLDDLYKTRDPERAFAEYTVYVPVGAAEDKFNEYMGTVEGAETKWQDRYWV